MPKSHRKNQQDATV